MALKMIEMGWDKSLEVVDAYYLDLLNYRDVSGSITKQLDIEHQSPQMLVLKGGAVLGVSNHSEINVDEIKKHL
tara:strand:+ start:385 stop:606 length:222 start_codon:yes stop_codon:yes gene_type:complete